MSVGFAKSPDGEWFSIDRSDCWGFGADCVQGHLLDYFTVDGIPVDPYDGGKLRGPQLDTLVRQLKEAVVWISGQPPEWPLHDEKILARYYEEVRRYGLKEQPPRDQALDTLNAAIRLAGEARKRGYYLVFCGD